MNSTNALASLKTFFSFSPLWTKSVQKLSHKKQMKLSQRFSLFYETFVCVCVCIWLLLVAEKVCFCNTLKSWEIFGGVKTNLLNGVYLLMAVFTHWISVLLLGCLSWGLTENETKPWANCQISTHIKRGKVHKRKHFQLRLKENVTSKQSHSYQISFQNPLK